jgi:hypothetical protein
MALVDFTVFDATSGVVQDKRRWEIPLSQASARTPGSENGTDQRGQYRFCMQATDSQAVPGRNSNMLVRFWTSAPRQFPLTKQQNHWTVGAPVHADCRPRSEIFLVVA